MANHGLIPSVSDNLWIGGSIPYEVRLESGDWRPFAPPLEKQADPLETMACVSFSLTDCLEAQYKFFGRDVNFSDRFLAKMSGTTQNGNTLEVVADTARNTGLVLENEWANNPKATTWAQYYAPIPQEVINKAVKQNFQYEWTALDAKNLRTQLKQSPIQITIIAPHPDHAVALLYVTPDGKTAYYQDHYNYQIKDIAVSSIAYALKIVLNKPTMTNSLIVKKGGEYGIYDPATSADGLITLLRNRGIEPPLKADGTLDFAKLDTMVQGQVS